MGIEKVKTIDNEIGYVKFGEGPRDFVIIPGLSLRSVLLAAVAVEGAYKDLCEDYTVYLFDRPTVIPSNISIKWMAKETSEAIKKLGLKDITLFGASQGGMISICIASNEPKLVKKLILASTTCKVKDASNDVFNRWISLAKTYDIRSLNHDFFETVFSKEYIEKYKEVIQEVEKQGTTQECDRFVTLATTLISADITKEANKVECPTMVLGSRYDKVFDEESIRFVSDNIGAGLYMYNEFGHACYDEAPDFVKRIKDYCGN